MRPDEPTPANSDSSREAAANVTRAKLEQIYNGQLENESGQAYHRTHGNRHEASPEAWQQYHTAWQQYYQKYYERYYVGAVQQAHKAYRDHAAQLAKQNRLQPTAVEKPIGNKDEAVQDLRQQLLEKVAGRAQKVRKSRHFIPAVAAFVVLLAFVFLQYNSIIVAYAVSYVSPGSVDPANIIVDPNVGLTVTKDPRLIIPKINVDVAVDYGAKSDYDSQMAAMKNGVAYFGIPGANSKPGQLGNVPIAGHSSNDFTDTGAGKFIFARLEQLKKGDTFYLNYKGVRYTYTVTKTMIVKPTDVEDLVIGNKKAMATLITCTPLGTATNRLLVFGEQISPSPDGAKSAPSSGGEAATEMAGQSPTVFERLFGAH